MYNHLCSLLECSSHQCISQKHKYSTAISVMHFWMFSILLKSYFPNLNCHRSVKKISVVMKSEIIEKKVFGLCTYRLTGYFNHQSKNRSLWSLLQPFPPLEATFSGINELYDKTIALNELEDSKHLRWRLMLKEPEFFVSSSFSVCLVSTRLCLSISPECAVMLHQL